ITRLSFVPLPEEDNTTPSTDNTSEILGDQQKSMANMRQRDSFCDFLDFQANELDRISARFTMGRDSFDWDTLGRKPNSEDNRTNVSKLNGSDESVNNSSSNTTDGKFNLSLDYVNTRRAKVVEEGKRQFSTLPTAPLRDRNSISKVVTNLKQIDEEESANSAHSTQQIELDCDSDKENPSNIDVEFDLVAQPHTPVNACNSTPNRTPESTQNFTESKKSENLKSQVANNPVPPQAGILQEIADLRMEMNSRFKQLESELKFNAEQNKWQIFTQTADIWARQMNTTEDIRDALSYLLQTDPFVNEFIRLKDENELLKAQLQQLMAKK
ncbi:uncharacterized protein LOC118756758, partial [Rhagoletis pomonella]|uniref:uncharacterized protein LOC118756758 n=1 Tax=Rhagoletis pomonella TaxID=28610 RepID=UPI001782474E